MTYASSLYYVFREVILTPERGTRRDILDAKFSFSNIKLLNYIKKTLQNHFVAIRCGILFYLIYSLMLVRQFY